MNFFRKIKVKILEGKIKKLPKSRNNKFHKIDSNKKIGLLIDKSDEKVLKRSENFYNFLTDRKINVEKIYFINRKIKKKETLPDDTFSIYGLKWIKTGIASEFVQKKFDILFILSFEEIYELHYLTAVANADLKVSPFYEGVNFADLTFILENNSYPYQFFDAVKNYLIDRW